MEQNGKKLIETFLEDNDKGMNQNWLHAIPFKAMHNLGVAAQNISIQILAAANVITDNFPVDVFGEMERLLEIANEMQEVEISLQKGTHFQPTHIAALRQRLRELESEKEELTQSLSTT
jgi:Tfp pilus assembly protein PilO